MKLIGSVLVLSFGVILVGLATEPEIVRPRPVEVPSTPTPLEPGALRNYDYVNEHKVDWRAAEQEFKQAVIRLEQREICGIEMLQLADRCSPKFQNGLPHDLIERLQKSGWRPMYFELKPLPEEGWRPYCNDPECKWCCANDPTHIDRILARVARRKLNYETFDRIERQRLGITTETDVVPARIPIPRAPNLVPVPEPQEGPVKRKRRNDKTTTAVVRQA